jgi:uncharacterized protein (TIGR03435 family)
LTIPAATVLSLVIAAYGQDCRLVEGGPAWIRSSEYYEITALLPAGTPSYTRRDFQQSNAPVLQTMLQNLLADRFQLVVKRELREMSVYVLTVSTPAKMKLSADQAPPVTPSPPAALPPPPAPGQPMTVTSAQLGWDQAMAFMSLSGEVQLSGHAISMSALATELRTHAGGLVLDRTGLKGFFDYDLKFARDMPTSIAVPSPQPQPIPPLPGPPPIPPVPAALLPAPSLGAALQEQLGLKMESVRMPIEVLVIERVERPSEN